MDIEIIYFFPIGGTLILALIVVFVCIVGLVNAFSAVAQFGESLKEYNNIVEVFANNHSDIVLTVCLIISALLGLGVALYTILNPNEPPGKLKDRKADKLEMYIEAISKLIFTGAL